MHKSFRSLERLQPKVQYICERNTCSFTTCQKPSAQPLNMQIAEPAISMWCILKWASTINGQMSKVPRDYKNRIKEDHKRRRETIAEQSQVQIIFLAWISIKTFGSFAFFRMLVDFWILLWGKTENKPNLL